MTTSNRLEHYQQSLGNIPPAISTMFAMDEVFANNYTDIREQIYAQRVDGLSLAMKELLLVMFDLAVSNPGGAINHLRAAKRAGLTTEQLRESLQIAFLVLGVSGWGKVGYKLWAAWENDFEEETSTNGHHAS